MTTNPTAERDIAFAKFMENAMRGDLEPDCVWNCAWEAASSHKESAWLPIASAPRDGTQYLAVNSRSHYAVCEWNTMEWASHPDDVAHEPCVFPIADATHWQPLPPLPIKE